MTTAPLTAEDRPVVVAVMAAVAEAFENGIKVGILHNELCMLLVQGHPVRRLPPKFFHLVAHALQIPVCVQICGHTTTKGDLWMGAKYWEIEEAQST